MDRRNANVLVHLAGAAGDEIRTVADDLVQLAGVVRVQRGAKLPKLLLVDYDPLVIGANSLVTHIRRRCGSAALVGM